MALKEKGIEFGENFSVSKWLLIVIVAIVVTLFVKDSVDRNMVAILQKEVESCIEYSSENDQHISDEIDCVREAWTWNFDWQE